MFPLRLAYAMTYHKCQGLTLEMVWLDLTSKDMNFGLTYVGLSRVKRFKNNYLSNFDQKRFENSSSIEKTKKQLDIFTKKLKSLEITTRIKYGFNPGDS